MPLWRKGEARSMTKVNTTLIGWARVDLIGAEALLRAFTGVRRMLTPLIFAGFMAICSNLR